MQVSFFNRLSIRQAKQTVLVAFFLGIILSVVQIGYDLIKERKQVDQTVSQVISMLRESAAQSVYTIDPQLAKTVVQGLFEYKPINKAVIIDDLGITLAHDERPNENMKMIWFVNLLLGEDKDFSVPLYYNNNAKLLGYIHVSVDQFLIAHNFFRRSGLIIITGLLRNIILAVILTLIFYHTLTRPLLKLVSQVSKVNQDKPAEELIAVPITHENNEMGLLVTAFNELLINFDNSLSRRKVIEEELKEHRDHLEKLIQERTNELETLNKNLELRVKEELEKRLRQENMMVQHSKMAAMGEMISLIAHQWRQPLSSISTIAGTLQTYIELGMNDEEEVKKLLTDINDYTQFLSATINDFRNFFKPDKKKESVSLNHVLDQTLTIIGTSIHYRGIGLGKECDLETAIYTYPSELMQVFLNILKNAHDALMEKKVPQPKIMIRGFERDNSQIVEISDNAGGIPCDILDRIFEPYFSTKEDKNGTGLGLYMSKTIIEEHCKGHISVRNEGDGACFEVALPNSVPESEQAEQ